MRRRQLFMACGASLSAQPIHLSIASGNSGGVTYPLSGAIANLLPKFMPGVSASAMSSAGSVDSLKLVALGKASLGYISAAIALDGLEGNLRGYPARIPVRVLISSHLEYLNITVAKDSGIRRISDLRGRRVSLGAPGSGVEAAGLKLLTAAGLTPADLKRPDRLGNMEAASAFKDRKLDAFFAFAAIPIPAVADVAATPGMTIDLVRCDEEARKLPAIYRSGIVPKGTYRGVDHDVPVLTCMTLLLANAAMEETIAYRITKTILEHIPELIAVHKAAREITLPSAASLKGIPYHPGAVRYYREKGVSVHV